MGHVLLIYKCVQLQTKRPNSMRRMKKKVDGYLKEIFYRLQGSIVSHAWLFLFKELGPVLQCQRALSSQTVLERGRPIPSLPFSDFRFHANHHTCNFICQ